MGMAVPTYYTAEMVRALPDDGSRYETVHGELLVTPSPRLWHQEIVRRLIVALSAYLDRHPVGHVLQSPADISWSDDTLVQPDLFVADVLEVKRLDWSQVQTLQLIIEVLSPTTSRYDRFTKRLLYQEQKIPYYWIVDPDRLVVEVWTPEAELPALERDELRWEPAGAGEPFVLNLAELFRPL